MKNYFFNFHTLLSIEIRLADLRDGRDVLLVEVEAVPELLHHQLLFLQRQFTDRIFHHRKEFVHFLFVELPIILIVDTKHDSLDTSLQKS